MACDHRFPVGRDDPHVDAAVLRAHAGVSSRLGIRIEAKPQPGETGASGGAYGRGVLRYSAGELLAVPLAKHADQGTRFRGNRYVAVPSHPADGRNLVRHAQRIERGSHFEVYVQGIRHCRRCQMFGAAACDPVANRNHPTLSEVIVGERARGV